SRSCPELWSLGNRILAPSAVRCIRSVRSVHSRFRSLLPIDRNTYPQPENRSPGAPDSSAAVVWTMFPKLSTDSTAATASATDMFMLHFNYTKITLLFPKSYRGLAKAQSSKATVSSLSPFRVVAPRYPPNSQPPDARQNASTNRVYISRASAGPGAPHRRLERLVGSRIECTEAHVP